MNYKGIKYTETFLSYPDIAPVAKSLEIPPDTTSGTPYTVPIIIHKPSIASNANGALHDSFPIALHLDKTFPAPKYPSIFPNGQASIALAIATEKLVHAAVAKFTKLLFSGVAAALDERGKVYFEQTRVPRFQARFPELDIQEMSDLRPKTQEGIDAAVADTQKELVVLTVMLEGRGLNSGPFLEGDKPGYADLILASYFGWFERSNPEPFQNLLEDGKGLLRRHWEASQPFLNGQGESKEWPIPRL